MTKRYSSSFHKTFDTNSASDMLELEELKDLVKIMNSEMNDYEGRRLPQFEGCRYELRLRGRGPRYTEEAMKWRIEKNRERQRRSAYCQPSERFPQEGSVTDAEVRVAKRALRQDLPIRFAEKVDAYIHLRRDNRQLDLRRAVEDVFSAFANA